MCGDPMEAGTFFPIPEVLFSGLNRANFVFFVIYFVEFMHNFLDNFGRKPTLWERIFVTVVAMITCISVYPVVIFAAYFLFCGYYPIATTIILLFVQRKRLKHLFRSEAIPTDEATTAELLTLQHTNVPTGIPSTSGYSDVPFPNEMSGIITNNIDNEEVQTSIGYRFPTIPNNITTAPQHRNHSSVFPSILEYSATPLLNGLSGIITNNIDNEEVQTSIGYRFPTIPNNITTAPQHRNHSSVFPSISEYSATPLLNELSGIITNNTGNEEIQTSIGYRFPTIPNTITTAPQHRNQSSVFPYTSEYSATLLTNRLSGIIANNIDNEETQIDVRYSNRTFPFTITTAPEHRNHLTDFPTTSEDYSSAYFPNAFSGNITGNMYNEEAYTSDGNRYQTIPSTVTTATELLSHVRRNHLRNFPSASEYSVAQLPNEVSAISPNSDENQATHIPDPTERIVEERESVRKVPTVKKRVRHKTPLYHPPKRRNRNLNSPLVNYTPDSSENDD